MKRSRKVLIIFAALAVVFFAALAVLWTNIDRIVKAAIEKYGSEVTRTEVRVSSVSIRLTAGEGAISGLTVANPRGFSSSRVFSLGTISARIDTSTVASGPVVIDEVRISAPQVVYEMNASGDTNIGALKKNIAQSTAGPPTKGTKKGTSAGTKARVFIRKLVIENGRIDVRIAAFGDRPSTVTLRRIELRDIGKHGGATPGQVAEQVLTALVEQVSADVARSGAERYVEKSIDRAVKKLFGK
jgi:hypothetical protein